MYLDFMSATGRSISPASGGVKLDKFRKKRVHKILNVQMTSLDNLEIGDLALYLDILSHVCHGCLDTHTHKQTYEKK